MENEILRKQRELQAPPFDRSEIIDMSHEISVSRGKPFGLQRVCQVLEFPRSTIYVIYARASSNVTPTAPCKREQNRNRRCPDADLAASPFVDEGNHKVWARLRIVHDIHISRTRVLRLMREHNLHEVRITNDRPNEMWGIDGVRIATVDGGMMSLFSTIDHCDGMRIGINATKIGDRFATLESISQGWLEEFGSVVANTGCGLSLRVDYGSQYTSDDFREQIKFWGIAASYGFVAEPQTNGVAERFNRTLKEQVIHGRSSTT